MQELLQNYQSLEASYSQLMKSQGDFEDWQRNAAQEQERLQLLQEQIDQLQSSNQELANNNTALTADLQQMQLQLGASKAETADFERDPNQASLMMTDLQA